MGELVVSSARLDGILRIGNSDVTAQAGVPLVSLQAALSEVGRCATAGAHVHGRIRGRDGGNECRGRGDIQVRRDTTVG